LAGLLPNELHKIQQARQVVEGSERRCHPEADRREPKARFDFYIEDQLEAASPCSAKSEHADAKANLKESTRSSGTTNSG
jgi:hypothetical protein